MPKSVWIIVSLVLAIAAFDAARPYVAADRAGMSASLLDQAEFWSFIAFLVLVGAVLLFRKYRSRK